MSNDFQDLLIAFVKHMKVKNYARATLNGYSRYLGQFFHYLRANEITRLTGVTRNTLTSYQRKLMELHSKGENTIATVSIKIRAVKRFFEYLESSNLILINPAEHIKEPKKESRLPKAVLTEDEALKILDMPDLATMIGIRDRAVLEVFYSTGIRLEELVNLTIYDCDLQGGTLRVNKGKFAKDRVVPLGKHAIRFLKEYVMHIRLRYTKKDKTVTNLFVTQAGHPLATQTIQQMVRNYAKKARIGKHVTPHVFRHTFATQLVRNGADITAVRKMLGHSRLSVTQIYTKVAGVDVRKTHNESHPREQDKEAGEGRPDVQGYFKVRDE